ncbi:DALR anticodon-binding domain-containing protein [Crassaminicella profunda]|uniref:DALR anticodon-binding domain-containing protein n=1 Tax=Crassaminicella profunda TaxID=1286698 RepID=UPI001CA6A0FD|nr:DALR anticodon-binding domain-containing protein [Crassaminicella profunda]QZY55473.1 hypothetical protein K7H06_00015 [Crassaminicella profunda]
MENKIKTEIQKIIKEVLKNSFKYEIEIDAIEVVEPKKDEHGDYTTNIALKLAKILKKNPMNLASEMINQIKSDYDVFEKVEFVHPGFMNFFFKPYVFCELLGFEEEEMMLNKKLLKKLLEKYSLKEALEVDGLKEIESVQYTHSRICSIMKIFEEEGSVIQNLQKENFHVKMSHLEKKMIKKIMDYPIVVKKSILSQKPEMLIQYIFELNAFFFKFHEKILFRKLDKQKLYVTLKIIDNIRKIIKNLLDVFSIEAPEKM